MISALHVCKTSLARFKYKLYLALVVRSLLPTIYRTVRFSILGSLPNPWALSIASQMKWVDVLLEVIEEGLLLPLYHCFGTAISDCENGKRTMRNRLKTGLAICIVVYATFEGAVSAAAPSLVDIMGQQPDLRDETVSYIRIELVAIVLSSLSKLLNLVVILYDWTFGVYAALAIQMVVSITMDIFLLSELDVSLKLGVQGAAWSSVISSSVTLVFLLIYCWIKLEMEFQRDIWSGQFDLKWIKVWSRVGFFSALDSMIRNVVYLVVVLRAMNLLQEQDSYWLANSFIWDWLLLPILPLTEVLKQDVATLAGGSGPIPHWQKMAAYFLLTLAIILIWAVTIPAWPLFIENVLKAKDMNLINILLTHMVPCYLFFNITTLVKGVFYALGRTEILAGMSFLVNLVLVAFFLMATYDVIPLTVRTVATIFGGGLVIGFIPNIIIYLIIVKRNGGLL